MTQEVKHCTEFHEHSISDLTNFMLKQREFCKKLCSRKGVQEVFKFLFHNIWQICCLKYLNPKVLTTEIRKIFSSQRLIIYFV
jgi:hypothetical protein